MSEQWYQNEVIKLQKLVKTIDEAMERDRDAFTKGLELAESRFEATLKTYKTAHEERVALQKRRLDSFTERAEAMQRATDATIARVKREALQETKAKDRQIEKLQKQLEEALKGVGKTRSNASDEALLAKASTLAIFDSILFAISNWSNQGDTAPDVELACQSVLFPVVYERVMDGSEDYLIKEVPPVAAEVVKRGRELVRHTRMVSEASLMDPEAWKEQAGMIHQWWVRDGLPLLYGARSEDWDDDVPLTLDEMKMWKEQPASRALSFPRIFDGMELVERFSQEIRDTTGLPDFNKSTLETRLEAII